MKYVDEFRQRSKVLALASAIEKAAIKPMRIMEVCGGHTMSIRKFGLRNLLPKHIRLISGPGCPVCVTGRRSIDTAIELARIPGCIMATYGDLMRVPGSYSSLDREKAAGRDIRMVYSTLDALKMAAGNPEKTVIFLGIGFETTTPSSAVAVLEAEKRNLDNFRLMCMHKTMPQAMMALINQGIQIDGFLGPGHVTAVAGANMYKPLVEAHNISVVVSGFEPVDILQSLYMLVRMHQENRSGIEIQYTRAVNALGNQKACSLVDKVFEPCAHEWRGLGVIENSGLKLNASYARFDAATLLVNPVESLPEPAGCICGEVLRGMKSPADCKLFGKSCTPANPVGACMVSSEGACQAFYQYQDDPG